MTASHRTILTCDDCAAMFVDDGGLVAQTFAETRARAKEAGWKVATATDWHDRCPSCATPHLAAVEAA